MTQDLQQFLDKSPEVVFVVSGEHKEDNTSVEGLPCGFYVEDRSEGVYILVGGCFQFRPAALESLAWMPAKVATIL